MALSLGHREVNWPEAGIGGAEEEELQRSAYEEVEGLVFGERKFKREDMPWNSEERDGDSVSDGGEEEGIADEAPGSLDGRGPAICNSVSGHVRRESP